LNRHSFTNALPGSARGKAAERGQSLKDFVSEALQDKLASGQRSGAASEPGWMRGFGKLRGLRGETRRIERRIRETFEVVEPQDRS
jgi:hypothetical protein